MGEAWDLTPEVAKWQMILTIGFFEFWRENSYVLSSDGETHYMRGGKPGYFPSFDSLPHPVPFNLFDPFKLSKNATPEKKAKGLLIEVNNGRLAMCIAPSRTGYRFRRDSYVFCTVPLSACVEGGE